MQLTTQSRHPVSRVGRWAQQMLFNRSFAEYISPLVSMVDPLASVGGIKALVESLNKDGAGATTIRLRPGRQWQGFVPGQYLPFTFSVDGVRLTRYYSISSSLALFRQFGFIEVTIKRVAGGSVSSWVDSTLEAGQIVSIGQADGELVLPAQLLGAGNSAKNKALYLAAGSGVTPFLSMLKTYGTQELHQQLIYSASSQGEHIQQQILEMAATANMSLNFHDSSQSDRLAKETLLTLCPDIIERQVLICGSVEFANAMVAALAALGVPAANVQQETFYSAAKPNASEVGGELVLQGVKAGMPIEVTIESNGTSILEQAEAQGFSPASGCRMGICHECTCKKTQGVVRNLLTGKLSSADEESIQSCISIPVGQVSVELASS
ncbi:MAG: hypothetical protein COA99_07615 [Moraxellaceae bacterium]|nr:MAG: hypothetical protein COA99_07615 [Moraxellaceae bacterium]